MQLSAFLFHKSYPPMTNYCLRSLLFF